jgi:hypothetical protein
VAGSVYRGDGEAAAGGIKTISDPAAGFEAYPSLRKRWDGRVARLRRATLYEADEMGRRIPASGADGFEKVELVSPTKALRVPGAEVDATSLRHGVIPGANLFVEGCLAHRS